MQAARAAIKKGMMAAGKRGSCTVQESLNAAVSVCLALDNFDVLASDSASRQLLELAAESPWIPELSKQVRMNGCGPQKYSSFAR